MKRSVYLVVALSALAAGINTINAASWFGIRQKITQADHNLAAAIVNGDIKSTNAAIKAGAKPNAKVDGHTSLFIQAFEAAIESDSFRYCALCCSNTSPRRHERI